MAGSDLPSGGSGANSPPPKTSTKRKSGDSEGPPSLRNRNTRSSTAATRSAKRKRGDSEGPPSHATRSSTAAAKAAATKAALGVVRTARRAATGALWAAKTGSGRGRGFGDVERMRAVILGVRLARSICTPDHPAYPYSKSSYLWDYPRKYVGTDPVEHLASVPEWEEKPSEEQAEQAEQYRTATLTKLGTIVCPLNKDISATDEPENTRKERVDKCNCSDAGSEYCVRVHIEKARSWIKDQLGEEAFKNCGLDATGEQVGELWTAADKKKLEEVDKLIPRNKHQKFMKIASRELSEKNQKDLAKYYFNVFLPGRLASLTRAKHKKDEAIDTGDEKEESK